MRHTFDYLRRLNRTVIVRYGFSVFAVFLATVVRWLLMPFLGTSAPLIIYFMSTIVAAWFGGFGPGVVATVLAAQAVGYLFLKTNYVLGSVNTGENLIITIYVVEGIAISLIIWALQQSRKISERQQVMLRESQERYKLLLDNVKDYGIFLTDMKGIITSWNPGIENILGYSEKEFIGRDSKMLFVPEDVKNKEHLKELRAASKDGTAQDKRWHVKKDGSRFFADGIMTVVKDRNGKKIGFTKIFHDITSAWQAEEAQRQKADILEGISDGFVSLDKKWNFTYLNNQGAKSFGKPASELVGKNIWEEFPQYSDTGFARIYKQAMKEGKPKQYEDYSQLLSGWYSVRAYPNKSGLSIYFQDITTRKELERQKDDFIGIATHELKTPVTSVKAYTQILLSRFNKIGDTESATLVSKMDAQLDRLTILIGDLLDATKIESGKLQFNEDVFVFDDVVREVVEELQRTTERHEITYLLNSKTSVYGDRDRVGQVMSNLISNAIKYSPHSDKIIVESSVEGKNIKFCVKDFGIGIPKEKQEKVFEKFYRVSGPKGDTFPGLGLGLYISSEIIKRQGGRIWIESSGVEKGSTFCFTLPIN